MAIFTITIEDADVPRVITALSKAGGFPTASKANALAAVRSFIRDTVANVEGSEAQRTAIDSLAPIAKVVLS